MLESSAELSVSPDHDCQQAQGSQVLSGTSVAPVLVHSCHAFGIWWLRHPPLSSVDSRLVGTPADITLELN